MIPAMVMIACVAPAERDTSGPDWSVFDGDEHTEQERPLLGTRPTAEGEAWVVSGEVWLEDGRASLRFMRGDCTVDHLAAIEQIDVCMPCRDAVSGVLGPAAVGGACPSEVPVWEGTMLLLGFGGGLAFAPSPEWQPAGTARHHKADGKWSFLLDEE